ncbi:putative bifunctional metalloprotease/ubiquitin-protein ligase [Megavirus vitis]|nr:putative bifunctional metalloprotease/ubiquitin-protein ligase [Megavirus vitis]
MSKQTNNRIVNNNKSTESKPKFRKCVHHILSHNYAANIKKHDDIIEKATPFISSMNMDETINVKILFHFLAPIGSYNREKVMSRAHDVIMSINDDFNNYTNNQNTMNNFKYKSIVNQIFASNMGKQNVYLGQNYLKFLPLKPSNITFELGEIYYYPVKNKLNLSKYDDEKDVEIQFQVIKQYIHQNRADAINPENFINIWIIDMTDTTVLGYSNFPWEMIDNFHGIIIHRRCFFPEDYQETNYSGYKTFSHELGHYFGLLHVGGGMEAYLSPNINAESEKMDVNNDNTKLYYISDPLDKTNCKSLHSDVNYNPLFMNFMDFTHDKYVTMFTNNQLQKMRYMINSYRPKINSNKYKTKILVPKYNPETNTITSTTDCKQSLRPTKIIPSYETIDNPRLNSQNQTQINNQQSNQQLNQQYNQQLNQQPMPNIHPSYTEYIASQTVPNLQPVPSKPKTEVNLPIHLLAPNLCGYSTKNSSNNDVISNIQNNIPVYEDQIIDKDAAAYEEFIKNYKTYNSDNGYAMSYPYDPYTIQEYYKNMAAIQKYSGQQTPLTNNDPRLNTYVTVPSQQQSQTQQNIQSHMPPQYQTQSNIPPQYQTQSNIQPQYQTQSNIQPQYQTQSNIQPQYQTQSNIPPQYQTQSNIQPQYYTQPNAQNQYPYSQNMTDPRIIQNLTANQLNIDQINKQQPQQQIPINNQNKRTDPQFTKSNLQNQRTIPKSVNTSNSEIHTETESSGIPSNLLNRINNLDQQVKNVKINDVSKVQPVTKPNVSIPSTQSEAKYNKYGQTSKVHTNNFVANKLKNNDNISGKIPKTRFQRYKPTGV